MHVAFVSVVPSPYQRDLFQALAERGDVDLSVFYLESAAPDSPWPAKPLAPYETVLRGGWFSVGSARCHVNWPLPNFKEYDLVVLNTLMSVTAQWLMRSRLSQLKWFFWGERLGRGGRIHQTLAKPLHRASGIAAIGSLALGDYSKRFPEPKLFNIPYHCDLDGFLQCPRQPLNRDAVTFLFCGQMIARKGVDVLLRAFSRLDERARLLLVGREAELPQLLSSLPADVQARISYGGFQAPEQLPEFFSQANVFILPSRYDGWGVVVNQALGAGLPILCSSSVGAAYDLVSEGENGRTFPAGDVKALTEAMQYLLDRPEEIERWGNASRARAEAWQPKAGAAKWASAFRSVLHE